MYMHFIEKNYVIKIVKQNGYLNHNEVIYYNSMINIIKIYK